MSILIAYHRPAVDNILSRNHAKQYLSPREALFIIIVRRYNASTCAEFFAFQPSAVLTWQANVLYIYSFTTKHARCFASNKALFLNTHNNVSTGVPNKYVCLSAIDALSRELFIKRDFNTAVKGLFTWR